MRRLLVLIRNLINIPYRIFCTHIFPLAILQEAEVDKTSAIASGVRFYRGTIGKYSYIDKNSFVSDTNIGAFCSIGSKCEIGGAKHPITWVSTSPVFHKWENIMGRNISSHEFDIFTRTTIGNDVWIGSNVMIKAGVNIGNGAIVGMGSVVTKDVGAYEIWAGNPAKKIRMRFDEKTIERLSQVAWWNWSDDKLEYYAKHMTDPKEFLMEIENG